MDRFIRQCEHVEQRIEVPHGGVDIDRLDWITPPEMDHSEGLAEANKILIVAVIPLSATACAVERIGRACHGTESDIATANRQIADRIARMKLELLGRESDLGLDERARQSHSVRIRLQIGASFPQDRSRAVVQEIHADFLEDGERGSMDGFDFVS